MVRAVKESVDRSIIIEGQAIVGSNGQGVGLDKVTETKNGLEELRNKVTNMRGSEVNQTQGANKPKKTGAIVERLRSEAKEHRAGAETLRNEANIDKARGQQMIFEGQNKKDEKGNPKPDLKMIQEGKKLIKEAEKKEREAEELERMADLKEQLANEIEQGLKDEKDAPQAPQSTPAPQGASQGPGQNGGPQGPGAPQGVGNPQGAQQGGWPQGPQNPMGNQDSLMQEKLLKMINDLIEGLEEMMTKMREMLKSKKDKDTGDDDKKVEDDTEAQPHTQQEEGDIANSGDKAVTQVDNTAANNQKLVKAQ